MNISGYFSQEKATWSNYDDEEKTFEPPSSPKAIENQGSLNDYRGQNDQVQSAANERFAQVNDEESIDYLAIGGEENQKKCTTSPYEYEKYLSLHTTEYTDIAETSEANEPEVRMPPVFNREDAELSRDEAIHLLTQWINGDQAKLIQLAEALKFSPLLLAQAGAYLKNVGLSIDEYLTRYNQELHQFLSEQSSLDGNAYDISIAAALNLNLAAIEEVDRKNNKNSVARDLLTFCSHVFPDNIPLSLIKEWLKQAHPEMAIEEAIDPLVDQHLLTLNPSKSGVSIHPTIQQIMQQRRGGIETLAASEKEHWWQMAAKSIDGAFIHIRSMDFSEGNKLQSALFPHLQVLLHHLEKHADGLKLEQAWLMVDIGLVLSSYIIADYRQAAAYYMRALAIQEAYYKDPNHIDLAATLGSLRDAYNSLGDYEEGRKAQERALAIQEVYYKNPNTNVTKLHSVSLYDKKMGLQAPKDLIQTINKKKLSLASIGFKNFKAAVHFFREASTYLTYADLRGLEISGDDCEVLKRFFTNLNYLFIGSSIITNHALAHLEGMPLKSVDFSFCSQLTDQSLRYLKGMPLESVAFSLCDQLTDEALSHLEGMSLKSVDFSWCWNLTDEALLRLRGMS